MQSYTKKEAGRGGKYDEQLAIQIENMGDCCYVEIKKQISTKFDWGSI